MDFLGGVADYSGGHVLPIPLRQMTTVKLSGLPQDLFVFRASGYQEVTLDATPWKLARHSDDGTALWKKHWSAIRPSRWIDYPLSCLLTFIARTSWWPQGGLLFEIDSDVPEAMGVSSSAALEIATLRALRQAAGLEISDLDLAHWGQFAENHWVGAPCGLMDQLASSCGRPAHFLPICCQPDQLGPSIPLPPGLHLVGWPSGVKHSVAGSAYGRARTAAFMGKKIIERNCHQTFSHAVEIPAALFAREMEKLPPALSGEDYLCRYESVDDPLSAIVPETVYPVRAALRFPWEESYRVKEAAQIITALSGDGGLQNNFSSALIRLGQLLEASHQAYSAMGLGAPETDAMGDAIRQMGPSEGFYGSRISGGGAGGTVVVLLESKALTKLENIRDQWDGSAGQQPLIVI